MASKSGNKIIAIEEHYFDPEIAALYDDKSGFTGTPIRAKMDDLYDMRIKDMGCVRHRCAGSVAGRTRCAALSMARQRQSWR